MMAWMMVRVSQRRNAGNSPGGRLRHAAVWEALGHICHVTNLHVITFRHSTNLNHSLLPLKLFSPSSRGTESLGMSVEGMHRSRGQSCLITCRRLHIWAPETILHRPFDVDSV